MTASVAISMRLRIARRAYRSGYYATLAEAVRRDLGAHNAHCGSGDLDITLVHCATPLITDFDVAQAAAYAGATSVAVNLTRDAGFPNLEGCRVVARSRNHSRAWRTLLLDNGIDANALRCAHDHPIVGARRDAVTDSLDYSMIAVETVNLIFGQSNQNSSAPTARPCCAHLGHNIVTG